MHRPTRPGGALRRLPRRLTGAVAVLAGAVLATAGAAAASPGVTPTYYADALEPGASVTITKTVETPPIPPRPDIVLMADTTGSMGASINNVKANANSILGQVQAAEPDARFAVAEYKDVSDGSAVYRVDQQLTDEKAAAVLGIGAWSASGGGDDPEAWIGALGRIPSTIAFRPDSTRVVVFFGDAPSHDPSLGFTLASATAGLQAAGIRVIAINVPGSGGLDQLGQATSVTSQTGGTLASANPTQVAATILSQLQNLPAVVTHDATCEDGVSLSFDQPSQSVTSGETTTFQETIAVAGDAAQGQTVSCTVRFLVNGELPGPQFEERVDITVGDATAPVVTVESKTVEATGPDGAAVSYDATATDNVDGPLTPSCVPPSGSVFPLGSTGVTCVATDSAGNTGTATGTITVVDTTAPLSACPESSNPGTQVPRSQNPDGFYRLDATDVVDTGAQVFLRDTGSGTVFGPFASGQRIKYTESGAGPRQRRIGDSDILHITGTGDAETYAVDLTGNRSEPVACLVPPAPR